MHKIDPFQLAHFYLVFKKLILSLYIKKKKFFTLIHHQHGIFLAACFFFIPTPNYIDLAITYLLLLPTYTHYFETIIIVDSYNNV